MPAKEKTAILTLYAISPIHAGTGQALAAIDLPIQRERHTQWPHIQASGMKGAMREHFRKFATQKSDTNGHYKDKEDKELINLIFGSDSDNDIVSIGANDGLAGAISVSDAKLFAFPMRSNISPFVHVTCPAVLKRLENDLEFCNINSDKIKKIKIPKNIDDDKCFVLKGNCNGNIILEDAEVNVDNNNIQNEITSKIPGKLLENIDNLLLISDSLYNYCVTSCTEIQTNIKIDTKTGTAVSGGLRYQELLPADSVLYSVIYFSSAYYNNELQADIIYKAVSGAIKDFLQVGGDATLGRGICKVSWIN